MIDESLLQFCVTPQQVTTVRNVIEHGSQKKAAKVMGLHLSTVNQSISAIRRRAALQGHAPAQDMTHTTPSPFVVKGVSTYYDKDGQRAGQWVKTKLDEQRAEQAIKDFITDLTAGIKATSPPIKAPAHRDADLLAVYPLGDPHFGLYAWSAECGDDFDTDLAERLTCAAIDRLVASAPPAETALIAELGDFFHSDDSRNVTPGHGNALDMDTRWARVMQIGLRAMVYCIQKAAAKHKTVIVRIVKGNHDPHSSFALALALDAYFHNNPRIKIDLSPAPHWFYRHGSVLLGVTHGDTTKQADLPSVMAADKPQDWGAAKHRYWYCGHIHHTKVQEYPGVVVEYFRTLAARDAWHSGQGYRAGRDMCCIVHHREHGEIERHRCDIGMLRKAA